MDGFSLDDDFLEAAAELLDIGTSSSLPSVASSPSSPYGEAMDSGQFIVVASGTLNRPQDQPSPLSSWLNRRRQHSQCRQRRSQVSLLLL